MCYLIFLQSATISLQEHDDNAIRIETEYFKNKKIKKKSKSLKNIIGLISKRNVHTRNSDFWVLLAEKKKKLMSRSPLLSFSCNTHSTQKNRTLFLVDTLMMRIMTSRQLELCRYFVDFASCWTLKSLFTKNKLLSTIARFFDQNTLQLRIQTSVDAVPYLAQWSAHNHWFKSCEVGIACK